MLENVHYMLDEKGEVVVEKDLMTWARWLESAGTKRQVGENIVGDYTVSTVFLGLDHDFSGTGIPVLWETLVFENKETEIKVGTRMRPIRKTLDVGDTFRRYTSKEDALKGHEEVMAYVASLAFPKKEENPVIPDELIEPEFPEAEVITPEPTHE